MMEKIMSKRVLVMCTGNSFRSHMAEAYIRKFGGEDVIVDSTGVKASGKISPWAVKLMEEVGMSLDGHESEVLEKFIDIQYDFLITVCDHANETCPVFPQPVGKKIHRSFPDYGPMGNMTEEDYMQTLRPIRNDIEEFCKNFVEAEVRT
jgi:arsenate reductase (thioredoxin)